MAQSDDHARSDAPGTRGGDLSDDDQLLKDRSYSPSSDRETDTLQHDPERPDTEVESGDRVKTLPGTGGPDDGGDIEVPADEVDLPRDEGAH